MENVGEVLAAADIILCSSGYTPYEVGVMGIPCIVLAQNEFEATLDFPSEKMVLSISDLDGKLNSPFY